MSDLQFRKMDLSEPVTITMPAHTWLGFLFSYADCEWSSTCASAICKGIQDVLLDPIYLREAAAEAQAHADVHQAFINHITGQPVDVPPNITDFNPPQPGDE